MFIARSQERRPKRTDAEIADLLRQVRANHLREYVDLFAYPRNYEAERRANVRARDTLLKLLHGFGYHPVLQGDYQNVIASLGEPGEGPCLLLGAHYDSVPGSPGADDNGSAIALCLECARLIRKHDIGSTMIVFFNREEDGLLGSRQFVESLTSAPWWQVEEAHIFEMVGYCSHATGSQHTPPGILGMIAPNVGDFLGLLANRNSNALAETLLTLAATYAPGFPVLALKVYLGIEKYFGDLLRSDHAPFWKADITSVMWTDTANFRNPHYHEDTDTPETLDYEFLAQVTRLALARAASRGE